MTRTVSPGDAPVAGPLVAAVVAFDRWAGRGGVHWLYADLDLAERADLRRVLGASPAATDAALAAQAYRQWGADAPKHLGGQFAFVVWDGDRQAVVAVRDPVGLRPLHHAAVPGGLVVGGDLRAVLAAEGVPQDLDDDVMAGALLTLDGSFFPGASGRTFYRGVGEVPGGHRLIADARGARVDAWWRLPESGGSGPRTPSETGEALQALLRHVTAEAVANEPAGTVGVHVSGGLDSSLVAALAAEARPGDPPRGYVWQRAPGPDEPRLREHHQIEAVAHRWGLPLTWCPATADDFLAQWLLDGTCDPVRMWALEEPVRRAAKADGVGLIVSGWGGDEAASFSGRGLVTPSLLRQGRWGALARRAVRDPRHAVHRLRRWTTQDAAARAFWPLDALREAALRGDLISFARPEVLRRARLPEIEPPPSAPRAYIGWLLRRGHLAERASAWALAGAARGVRYRYPLLDRRVLALALHLPPEAWLTQRRAGRRARRWPFRDAMAGLVPDAVRLGSKAEPARVAATVEAIGEAASRLARLVTLEAAGDRARYVALGALRAALADRAALDADFRAFTRGPFTAAYLGLGSGLGTTLYEDVSNSA